MTSKLIFPVAQDVEFNPDFKYAQEKNRFGSDIRFVYPDSVEKKHSRHWINAWECIFPSEFRLSIHIEGLSATSFIRKQIGCLFFSFSFIPFPLPLLSNWISHFNWLVKHTNHGKSNWNAVKQYTAFAYRIHSNLLDMTKFVCQRFCSLNYFLEIIWIYPRICTQAAHILW